MKEDRNAKAKCIHHEHFDVIIPYFLFKSLYTFFLEKWKYTLHTDQNLVFHVHFTYIFFFPINVLQGTFL